ncbi:MAG: SPASM domain-containing protein [Elainellaceae cyanobacterium]
MMAITVKMGNIYEQSFQKIWNSEQCQAFRISHIEHDVPSYCQRCYVKN